jgi:hypothetical protein
MGDRFDEFWQSYPRRIAKLAALKAWNKSLKHDTADNIIAGALRFARQRAGQDPKFTPHPATWLNAGRWMDEPEQQHLTGVAALSADLRRRIDDETNGRQGSQPVDDDGGFPLLSWEGRPRYH